MVQLRGFKPRGLLQSRQVANEVASHLVS